MAVISAAMLLWVLLTFPRVDTPGDMDPEAAASYALEQSIAGRLGHAIEPAIEPLGFDWKIGVGLVASLAAREILVATLAQIYAAEQSDDEDGGSSLREALVSDVRPDGTKVFDPPTVGALLVFFVFALQCTSTIAIIKRETNSWGWTGFAFSYLFALAYAASFLTHRVIGAFA